MREVSGLFTRPSTINNRKDKMIIRCVHCGYEGAKEGFQYLYKARLDDPGGWRRCPKCGGWALIDDTSGKFLDYEKLVASYPTNRDKR